MPVPYGSEFKAQCELHGARIHRALKFPERLRRLQAQTRIGEIRMVESVERLGTELKSLPFPGQVERLGKRHVDIENRIQPDRRARSRAFRRLVLKIIGHAGVRENAGDAVFIDMDSAGRRWECSPPRAS